MEDGKTYKNRRINLSLLEITNAVDWCGYKCIAKSTDWISFGGILK